MNNPFFVLTSNDNEIIGVIYNSPHPRIADRIEDALMNHYDVDVIDLKVPEDIEDSYKPISVSCTLDDEQKSELYLTLTPAWSY